MVCQSHLTRSIFYLILMTHTPSAQQSGMNYFEERRKQVRRQRKKNKVYVFDIIIAPRRKSPSRKVQRIIESFQSDSSQSASCVCRLSLVSNFHSDGIVYVED